MVFPFSLIFFVSNMAILVPPQGNQSEAANSLNEVDIWKTCEYLLNFNSIVWLLTYL